VTGIPSLIRLRSNQNRRTGVNPKWKQATDNGQYQVFEDGERLAASRGVIPAVTAIGRGSS